MARGGRDASAAATCESPERRTAEGANLESPALSFRGISLPARFCSRSQKKKETEQRPAEVGKRELFLWTSQQTGRTVGRFEDLRDGEVLLKVFLKVLLPSNF